MKDSVRSSACHSSRRCLLLMLAARTQLATLREARTPLFKWTVARPDEKQVPHAKLHIHLHRRSMPGSWCLHCHAEFQGHRCKALTEHEKSVIVLLTKEAQEIPYRWGGNKLPNTYESGEYGCAGWLCHQWTAHERREGAWCGDLLCKFCGAYVESMGPSLEVITHHVKWQSRG